MTATAILAPVKFCKKCQCDTERRNDGRCSPCATAYFKKYYEKNAERLKAYQASLYEKNPEIKKAHSISYYAANIETIKPKRLAYAKRVAAHVSAKSRKWAQDNPERYRQRLIEWRKANPDAMKVIHNNRRSREKSGVLSRGIVKALFASQKGLCPCCRKPLGKDYHLDHILPLFLGGTNSDDNVQLLRARCNLQKNAKHPVDFMQSRGFLI